MKRLAALAPVLLLLGGCATVPTSTSIASLKADSQVEQGDPSRLVIVTFRNPNDPAVPRAGSTVRDYDSPQGYSVSSAARASVTSLATMYALRELSGWPIAALGVHCVVFEIPADADRDALIGKLRHDARVESAQPLQSFRVLASTSATPRAASMTASLGAAGNNDPYRGLQRNLDAMGVSQAHHWSRGEGVKIAIIDTGIDAKHPDLVGRVAREQNFVAGSAADFEKDRHGTAVAGVIAAVGDNNQGIVGIAPAARLYAFRACWPERPNSPEAVCNTFTLAKALAASLESNADVVNLSLSGPADPLLTRLVATGIRRGIVYVGAIAPPGNESAFPSGIDGVIGVDASGSRSADGTVLYAPGTDVLTLVPDGRYDFMSGSSLSAASVSGGIALLLAREPKLRSHELQSLLARSTRSVATLGNAAAVTPTVNLCEALSIAMRSGSCN